jgi:hypothetical protein
MHTLKHSCEQNAEGSLSRPRSRHLGHCSLAGLAQRAQGRWPTAPSLGGSPAIAMLGSALPINAATKQLRRNLRVEVYHQQRGASLTVDPFF